MGRKTHCPNGHAYDEANTRYEKDGSRKCRACDRERHRAKSAAKAALEAVGSQEREQFAHVLLR